MALSFTWPISESWIVGSDATTWSDIHHFKIPFGQSSVNVFATDYEHWKFDGSSHHAAALEHCLVNLREHHAELQVRAKELEDSIDGF